MTFTASFHGALEQSASANPTVRSQTPPHHLRLRVHPLLCYVRYGKLHAHAHLGPVRTAKQRALFRNTSLRWFPPNSTCMLFCGLPFRYRVLQGIGGGALQSM